IAVPSGASGAVSHNLPGSIVSYASIQPFEAAQNSNIAWRLVYQTKLDRILALSTTNALTLLGLSFAVLLVFGAASVAIIGGATRPLKHLADVSGQIAAGNLNATLPAIRRTDEVGTLGAAMANMVNRLRQSIDQLRVAEEREKHERRRAERLAYIT